MAQLSGFLNDWHGVWRFLALFGVGFLIALAIKAVVFRVLRRLAGRTAISLDDEIIEGLNWPARLIALCSALDWAIGNLGSRAVPAGVVAGVNQIMAVLIWIAVTVALSRVAITCLIFYFRNQPDAREVTTLTRTAVSMVCSIPAVLGLLNVFEVSLTPALTALGVGGIAVSLALKDTLANLFSGFYVSLAGNLRRGDYIRIDGGYEGWVEDIRWRITTIKTLGGNLVVIPNSKLSEAVVMNFSQPARPLGVSIPLNVAYSTDIDEFEEVVLGEVRKSFGTIEGLLEEPPPVLRLNPGFGDLGLSFTLSVYAARFEQQFAVTDQLRRRLLKRFRREGITLVQLRPADLTARPPGA